MKSITMLAALIGLAWCPPQDPPAGPKEEIFAAARKLAEQDTYAWSLEIDRRDVAKVSPGASQPILPMIVSIAGRSAKSGFVILKQTRMANVQAVSAILKGTRAVLETMDGWKLSGDLDPEKDVNARFFAGVLPYYPAPTEEVKTLLEGVRELKEGPDGGRVGELSEAAARTQVERTLKGGGRKDPPEIKEPRGTVRFWIQDGLILKYDIATQAKVTVNDVEIVLKRTLTVKVKDVNTTPVPVPEEASKILR
ncbi:MAG TPA: hypothetical protein VK661_10190 [Planctomycetota bacterium]|nr:hypothetical protein [Planctomycetota bacterium]